MIWLLSILVASPAVGGDTWTTVAPGVDWLYRTTGGSTPQRIHVAKVDLTRSTISVQASMDAVGSQRRVTTSTFAKSIGATVAINGDWGMSSTSTPVGMSMGNGWLWNPHFDNPSIGGEWGYFACDIFNQCEADTIPRLSVASYFSDPGIQPYRYFNAIGANGLQLIDDGVRQSGCYDSSRHPRTAICVTRNSKTMYMMVVDGRRSSASGMTCDEVRDLAQSFNCWDAAMLDGGGSSTMWVDGRVRNVPSDGSERTRPNHIGIVVKPSADSECTVTSGRWCNGTEISTCSGGRYLGTGDCGVYGATCEEDGDWAYCVNYQCPDGDGQGMACLDDVLYETCTDGVYSTATCATAGMVCGEDSKGAACMDDRCEAGPHSSYCVDDTTIGSCTEGSYNTTQCVGDETCVASGETASCVAPEPEEEDTDVTEPEEEDTDVTEPEEEDPTEEEAPEGSVRPDAPTPPTLGCNVSPSTTWPAWAMVLWSLAAVWRRRDPNCSGQ